MKNILYLILCLILTTTISFKPVNNLKPEIITWDTHFKAKPDYASGYAAVTSTIWQYSYTSTIKNDRLTINFKFIGGVDPDKSWVDKRKINAKDTSQILLNHEQGHVYINFFLLKNGENFIRNQPYTLANYKRLVIEKAREISNYYNNMQLRYDEETKHGADAKAQQNWDVFFEEELDKVTR